MKLSPITNHLFGVSLLLIFLIGLEHSLQLMGQCQFACINKVYSPYGTLCSRHVESARPCSHGDCDSHCAPTTQCFLQPSSYHPMFYSKQLCFLFLVTVFIHTVTLQANFFHLPNIFLEFLLHLLVASQFFFSQTVFPKEQF